MSEVECYAILVGTDDMWQDMLDGMESKPCKMVKLNEQTRIIGILPCDTGILIFYRTQEEAIDAFHKADELFNDVKIVRETAYIDKKFLKKYGEAFS